MLFYRISQTTFLCNRNLAIYYNGFLLLHFRVTSCKSIYPLFQGTTTQPQEQQVPGFIKGHWSWAPQGPMWPFRHRRKHQYQTSFRKRQRPSEIRDPLCVVPSHFTFTHRDKREPREDINSNYFHVHLWVIMHSYLIPMLGLCCKLLHNFSSPSRMVVALNWQNQLHPRYSWSWDTDCL